MRQRIFKLAVGIAGLAFVGGGVTLYIAAQGDGEEVVPQGEIILAPTASASTAAPACAVFVKDVPCNPDAGLSDAERHALYERLRSEGHRLHREWLAFPRYRRDRSALPTEE